MVNLYISSVEPGGKTALCAGIGRQLLNRGKKVGYIIPVQLSENDNANGYRDANFIKEALELKDTPELISPFHLSNRELWQNLTDEPEDFTQRMKKAYAKISKGKDVVIMEGLSGLTTDNVSTLACYRIVEVLDAKVIIVLRYSATLAPSDLARVAGELGKRLVGVVINFVPESKIEAVEQNLVASFQEAGIKVLGILPEVRSLMGVSVDELTGVLDGEILTCPENTGELVENVMLGAMTIDSGIDYFNRKENKAAVIRGERADMQLAALETSTKCLILTNNVAPLPAVVFQAESKHVPIMIVDKDTSGVIADIEQVFSKPAFNNSQKLKRFEGIIDKYLDFTSLYLSLGLKS